MRLKFLGFLFIGFNAAFLFSAIQNVAANMLPGLLAGENTADAPATEFKTKNLEVQSVKYDANWESLDARPLPAWYDSNKIGIFIHWGVFSVPAFKTEWFWSNFKAGDKRVVEFMKRNYPPNFTYQEFAPQFTAEFYNATEWVQLFKKAGARYVVLTSKHHEGYTLWPSKYSFSWNSMDVGPHRDLVGELAEAVRGTSDLRFGLYHSLYEWFNPLWISDKNNSFTTQDFVNFKTLPELYEIVNAYKPEIIWSDGEWDASAKYWKSEEFLAWLYNESPVKDTVLTNDRWGGDTLCKHGGYYTCKDGYNPGVLQPRKWENCYTLDRGTWGYRRNANLQDYVTPHEMITALVRTIACGGNILVNIGPTKEGIIVPIQQERLLQLGEWLDVNGEAIYDTVPWTWQNDTLNPNVWYTTRPAQKKIYAITLDWPENNTILLQSVDPAIVSSVRVLGSTGLPNWVAVLPRGIEVTMPAFQQNKSKWAWSIVINTI